MFSTEMLSNLFDYNESLEAYVQNFDDIFEATAWKNKMREMHSELNFEQKNNRILITLQTETALT